MIDITSKINNEVRTFAAGDATGFDLSLGVKYYDYKTKTKAWTNYKCVLIGKDAQANLYSEVLTVGSVLNVVADAVIIDKYTSKTGEEKSNLLLVNPKLNTFFKAGEANSPQPKPSTNQPKEVKDFDDDIPW